MVLLRWVGRSTPPARGGWAAAEAGAGAAGGTGAWGLAGAGGTSRSDWFFHMDKAHLDGGAGWAAPVRSLALLYVPHPLAATGESLTLRECSRRGHGWRGCGAPPRGAGRGARSC